MAHLANTMIKLARIANQDVNGSALKYESDKYPLRQR